MLKRSERIFIFATLAPTFAILFALYVYPTFFNLLNSLTDLKLTTLRRGGEFVGLANYEALLTGKNFPGALWNTVFWLTAVPLVIRIVAGLALALLLNANVLARLRLVTITRLCTLVPWATPPIVAVVAWRWLLDGSVGPINAFLLEWHLIDRPIAFLANLNFVWPSLVLIMVWNTLPLVTITFLAALQSVPVELLEAAEADGAGPVNRFLHVTLPHLMPSIVVMTLMLIFWSFNNFVYVWLATGAGPGLLTNVLATEIYLRAFVDLDLGMSSAVGMVMAACMIVINYFYYRQIALRQFRDIF